MKLLLPVGVGVIVSFLNLYGLSEGKSVSSQKKSVLSIFISDIEKYIKKGKVKDQCFKKKKAGKEADASQKDSPIDSFGYTEFDQRNNGFSKLNPGMTLSRANKHNTPVKIGAQDYYFVGTATELISFCACFENYEVIGSTLGANDRWTEKAGSIKIQLQNVQAWSAGKNPTLFDMIFKITLDRIVRELDPAAKIASADKAIFGSSKGLEKIEKFKSTYEKMKKWIPAAQQVIDKIGEILKKNLPPQKMYEEVKKFIEANKNKNGKGWQDGKNIDTRNKLIAVLTMYTKPANNVRATYDFGVATIKMGDVGKAIKERLDKLIF